MNKKSIDKEKARVEKDLKIFQIWLENKIKLILEVMLFDFIDLKIHYIIKDRKMGSGDAMFDIDYIKKYRQASINIYPQIYKLYKANEKTLLIDGLVHELTHNHTIPFMNLAEDRYINKRELMDASEELTEVMSEYIRRYIKKENPKIYNN